MKIIGLVTFLVWGLVSGAEAEVIRAIYLPNDQIIPKASATKTLLKDFEVNGVVINLRDDSGIVLLEEKNPKDPFQKIEYLPQFKKRFGTSISEFKELGAHIICRFVTFKEYKYAESNKDVAVKDSRTNGLWKNNKGEHWIDPTSEVYTAYLLKIAKNGIEAGCEEIQFDYIRFPSGGDGPTKYAHYPLFAGV